MSALAQKLARLKQQAGADVAVGSSSARFPAQPASPGGRSHGIAGQDPRGVRHRQQVAQLRKLMGLRPGNAAMQPLSRDRSLDGEEIAPGLRRIEMRQPAKPPAAVLDLSALRMEPVAASRILAFDTETTGLAGGTGTRAFMIGAADWRNGELRIRQLLMTTLAAEQAMLAEFSRWLADDTVLLSYNGKSYDRPLLTTRYTLARQPDPLPGLGHIDLLHPARRRWRGVWENCRLATIERQVLGVMREDDLPGSEAPAAWLSYLRGGSAEKLRRVGHHNAQDLRSLFGLLEHFVGLAGEPPPDAGRLPLPAVKARDPL
ncbi:ribonuclease H-like domain-containing protein [Luteimonas sp. A277]